MLGKGCVWEMSGGSGEAREMRGWGRGEPVVKEGVQPTAKDKITQAEVEDVDGWMEGRGRA